MHALQALLGKSFEHLLQGAIHGEPPLGRGDVRLVIVRFHVQDVLHVQPHPLVPITHEHAGSAGIGRGHRSTWMRMGMPTTPSVRSR